MANYVSTFIGTPGQLAPDPLKYEEISAIMEAFTTKLDAESKDYEKYIHPSDKAPHKPTYTAAAPGKCPTCSLRTVITRDGVDKCEACS